MTVGCAAYAGFALQSTSRAAQTPADPATLYQLFEAKGLKTVEFADRGWAYHVEAPSPEKVYIAGVRGADTQAQAAAAFAGPTAGKAADLMIVVCGREFGDDDCDFYSPLHEVPRNGPAIRQLDGAIPRYQTIVSAAAVAAGSPR
jgi:hypothetical protein